MKKISCLVCPNKSCIIKDNLVSQWSGFIEEDKNQAFYKKDHSIFAVGNPILGLFFVQSGLIKEFILRPQNEIDILRFAKEGQAFGHAGFENNYYTSGADSKLDSVICFFTNESLRKMYELNPKLLYDLMMYYSNEHSETTHRLMSISQMNLREKIASVLFYLFENFGLNEEGEILECFNREDIASLAFTTSEQVSRQLSDFQKEKIIDKRGRKIAILKPTKLKDIIKNYLIINSEPV